MKFVKALAVTLVVAAAACLTGVNALHPWEGLRFTPTSDLELGIALFLTMVSTIVCIWRLTTGSSPSIEPRRFGDALSGPDDLS